MLEYLTVHGTKSPITPECSWIRYHNKSCCTMVDVIIGSNPHQKILYITLTYASNSTQHKKIKLSIVQVGHKTHSHNCSNSKRDRKFEKVVEGNYILPSLVSMLSTLPRYSSGLRSSENAVLPATTAHSRILAHSETQPSLQTTAHSRIPAHWVTLTSLQCCSIQNGS